jgi:twitching motility protein PilT
VAQIDDILRLAKEHGASDLHLSPGSPPMARVHGDIVPLDPERLSRDGLHLMLFDIADAAVRERFEQRKAASFAYEVPGVVRARCSLYEQARGIAGAFRLLPAGIPTLEDLDLPREVGDLVLRPVGLVVVSGPAGSGRSSTLAALVGHVNRHLGCHIVTLEDPIEFKHACQSSLVDQREIGRHTPGLAQGLRSALHEDADVIAMMEPQDSETMELALEAAAGRLLLVTLTAADAAHAVDSILDRFPAERRARAATRLATALVAVLRQRLLPRADHAGRVLALELLLNTPAAATLIREQRTAQLDTLLRNRGGEGMCAMDDAIAALVRDGRVSAESLAARVTVRPGLEPEGDAELSEAA